MNGPVNVDFEHLLSSDHNLAEAVAEQFYRFEAYLRRGVQRFVSTHFPAYAIEGREFFIGIYNMPALQHIRHLKTDKIGRLVSVSGTVTRSSEVRPELLFGTFECDVCGMKQQRVEHFALVFVVNTLCIFVLVFPVRDCLIAPSFPPLSCDNEYSKPTL